MILLTDSLLVKKLEKNGRKIGKIDEISEIPNILAKIRDYILHAHVLKFLEKYR